MPTTRTTRRRRSDNTDSDSSLNVNFHSDTESSTKNNDDARSRSTKQKLSDSEEDPPPYSLSARRSRGSRKPEDEESLLGLRGASKNETWLHSGKRKKSRRSDEEEESDETSGESDATGSGSEGKKSSDSSNGGGDEKKSDESDDDSLEGEKKGGSEDDTSSSDDEKGGAGYHKRRRKKKKSKKQKKQNYIVLGIIICLILAIAGFAIYYFGVEGNSLSGLFGGGTSSSSVAPPPASSSSSQSAPPVSSPASPPPTSSSATGSNSDPFGTSVSPTSSGSASAPSGSSTLPSPLFVLYTDAADTLPEPSDLPGINVFNLAFWMLSGPTDNVQTYVSMSSSDRAAYKAKFVAANVKLICSIFGSEDKPTTDGADPAGTADKVAAFVIQYDLDGADIDYEDNDKFGSSGDAENWLITFQTELRKKLPSPKYIISHAPQAPWFTTSKDQYPKGAYTTVDKAVGSGIDFYNVQYYNQDGLYDDCTSLISDSGDGFPGSSVLETVAQGIPQNKVVLGKPADKDDANTQDYMTASALNTCVEQGKAKGWKGGLMYWEYHPGESTDYVSQAWGS